AQLQVNNGTAGVDADLVREIRRVPEVETVSGNVEYTLAVPALGRPLTIFGIELGDDDSYRREQFGPAVLDVPDTLVFLSRPDSIAVAQEVLDEHGWTVGSAFDVQGPKGVRRLTVRGVVHPSGALHVFGGSVAVMDADAAQLAFGKRDKFHWI